ncbi:ATP-dependent DNA helicase RecG [bacterium]|nr:ATP-dependent DNA helicase RecG [bacterium]|tara:strand:+ start:1490 stop:3535 length:2046 start_codon:yes stop_codon:yes gene_type:complete
MLWDQSVQTLAGVGHQWGSVLARMGIHTVWELIHYFPLYHEDRAQLPSIKTIAVDVPLDATVSVWGCVSGIDHRNAVSRVQLTDPSGTLSALWFRQPHVRRLFRSGQRMYVSGKVHWDDRQGARVIHVSDYELVTTHTPTGLTPIYALVKGMNQRKIRQVITTGLSETMDTEYLPNGHVHAYMGWADALRAMHFPNHLKMYQTARHRLAFDEWLWFQVATQYQKRQKQAAQTSEPLSAAGTLIRTYCAQLPYTLTAAQQRVILTIQSDIQRQYPMNRLVQGDVGCGKTDVAIAALLMAVESGKKGVLMAPTDVLATQHYIKLSQLLTPLGVSVVCLKGALSARDRQETLAQLAQSGPLIVVGTQALVQSSVLMHQVGLVVVDEQHRFGVLQRLALHDKGQFPHALYMTATPIPRSLVLTMYRDLEHSIIDEKPPNRQDCETVYVHTRNAHNVFEYCARYAQAGRQVYVVYPVIEESESHDLKAATAEYQRLCDTVFSAIPVGLLHGRLSVSEKQTIMTAFKSGELAILISTTVIEVGVDVPNASIMVIYHAERFGLSSLHQLRGRVGRGSDAATCFLVANPKTPAAKQRIKAMVDTSDGFEIAQRDLTIRGGGDVLGTRQSGMSALFRIADIQNEDPIRDDAGRVADAILAEDPDLASDRYAGLKQRLEYQFDALLYNQLN